MSVTSCLLLLIVCLSLHVCDGARRLGSVDKQNEKKFGASLSKSEENNTSCGHQHLVNIIPTEKPSLPKDPKAMDGDDINGNRPTPLEITKKLKASKIARHRMKRDLKRKRSLAAASQESSLVSVSWRVPHKKPSAKDPGFNSDYSPPKTHPPSHN